jgi:redox-sensitive bicupin YhaK (pirin superfamily)
MRIEQAKELRTSEVMRSRHAFLPDTAIHTDPFLALAEDWVDVEGGFPEHPHRGFETVTLVLEGAQEHHDSTGQTGVLYADDVQWMTAGRGVLHSEMPRHSEMRRGGFHGLQLWVNLPASERMRPARYQNVRAGIVPAVARDGARVRVIAGEHDGVHGVAETITPMQVLDVRLEEGARFVRASGRRRLAYIIDGNVEGHPSGSVLYLDGGDQALRANAAARLLWMEGDPIGEPIVARGPFVMNTTEQISEAYRDLRAGRLTR